MAKFGFIHNKSQYFENILKRLNSSPNVYIIGEAPNLESFLEIIPKRTMLDYLLIEMPEKLNEQHFAQLKILRKRQVNSEIILFGPDCTIKTLLTLLKSGISGYILTINNTDFFVDLLSRKESLFFSPEILKKLVHHHRPSVFEESNTIEKLTPRQLDILKLLAEGQTYDNIASILNISMNGVKFHLKAIYSKFEVENRIQAIKFYENNLSDFLS
jgi:DNA-binding NarL/FixJ family response regulator